MRKNKTLDSFFRSASRVWPHKEALLLIRSTVLLLLIIGLHTLLLLFLRLSEMIS